MGPSVQAATLTEYRWQAPQPVIDDEDNVTGFNAALKPTADKQQGQSGTARAGHFPHAPEEQHEILGDLEMEDFTSVSHPACCDQLLLALACYSFAF